MSEINRKMGLRDVAAITRYAVARKLVPALLCLLLIGVADAKPPKHGTIIGQVSPTNSGVVSGGGTFSTGTSVTITARAFAGWQFTQWQDANTNATRTVTVPVGPVIYVANFQTNPPAPPVIHFATIAWDADPPWARVATWRVYWGPSTGNYTNFLLTTELTASVSNLVSKAPYFFAVKAYDPSGLPSFFSNEVTFTPP